MTYPIDDSYFNYHLGTTKIDLELKGNEEQIKENITKALNEYVELIDKYPIPEYDEDPEDYDYNILGPIAREIINIEAKHPNLLEYFVNEIKKLFDHYTKYYIGYWIAVWHEKPFNSILTNVAEELTGKDWHSLKYDRRVEENVTIAPLSSETVRKSFPVHGYSKVLLFVFYRLLSNL